MVVILGGGFGGVRVALDLAKRRAANIVLIDRNSYHSLPTHYYEVATAFEPEHKNESRMDRSKIFHELIRSAAIPLEDIFGRFDAVKLVRGEVSRVDPKTRRVILEGGRVFSYDYLVIALGSATNYFGISHLEDNSLGLKTVMEAANVRNRIDELFLQTPKHKKVRVVVGGGGFTGVELAAELVGYMNKLAQIHACPHGHWECVIVEAGPTVLGVSPEPIRRMAQRRLQRLGVTVLCDSPIVDVWPNLIHIGKEKRPFPFDLLVWTAGVKGACTGDIIEGALLDKKHCVNVTDTLHVGSYADIFTVGDVAGTLDPKTRAPMPMTAQKAIHEAKYVARAIIKLSKNPKTVLRPYFPKYSSYIIPLGGKFALLDTPLAKTSGFFVWALKYVVLLRYLKSILPIRRALWLLAGELALFTKND